jgi:hypothetical protein
LADLSSTLLIYPEGDFVPPVGIAVNDVAIFVATSPTSTIVAARLVV